MNSKFVTESPINSIGMGHSYDKDAAGDLAKLLIFYISEIENKPQN